MVINPINPVAFELFGFPVRWYALAYMAAFIAGIWLFKLIYTDKMDKKSRDDFAAAVIMGVIAGGRLGYVLFYNPVFFLHNPWEIFMIWHGGMSFHGGLIGVILACLWFGWRRQRRGFSGGLRLLDAMAGCAPIGLFFGRLANFINQEVMGRATDGPLGVSFAGGDPTPRYPSPLIEAGLEGIALFIIMIIAWRNKNIRNRAGVLSGIFGLGYSVFRIMAEFFRAPDAHIGFIAGGWLTMGMLLSGVMLVLSVALLYFSIKGKFNDR